MPKLIRQHTSFVQAKGHMIQNRRFKGILPYLMKVVNESLEGMGCEDEKYYTVEMRIYEGEQPDE